MNKFLNFLLLLCLLNFSVETQKYSLAIYGDNGQITFWFKNQITSKDKKLVAPFYENILSQESYEHGPFQCRVTYNDDITNLVEKEGFENFNHLNSNADLREMVKNADGVVFMGDVIYLETKRLTAGKPGFLTLKYEDKWADRLKCGWNLFFESLRRIGLAQLAKEANFMKHTAEEGEFVVLDNKIEILAGNHSQDYDLFAEEAIVSSVAKRPITKKDAAAPKYKVLKESFGNTEKLFTESPRLITITFKDFDIQFLDFNSANIFCLEKDNEAEFNKCGFAPKFTPFMQARAYGWKLVQYLRKMKLVKDENNQVTRRVWKVLRSHHPPLNTEDGDSNFYFHNIFVDNGQQSDFQVNLWEIMKERKINVFFGSHTHQAQVLALPFNYNFKKVSTGCEKKPAWGCYVVDPSVDLFTSEPQLQTKCKNEVEFTLPINAKHEVENDMLYVFVFGHSGRILDGLKSGRNSTGVLLWARAQEYRKNQLGYGFAMADFTREKLSVHFYETKPNKEAKLVKTAKFEVVEGQLPDMSAVAQYIDGKVCPGKKKKNKQNKENNSS